MIWLCHQEGFTCMRTDVWYGERSARMAKQQLAGIRCTDLPTEPSWFWQDILAFFQMSRILLNHGNVSLCYFIGMQKPNALNLCVKSKCGVIMTAQCIPL